MQQTENPVTSSAPVKETSLRSYISQLNNPENRSFLVFALFALAFALVFRTYIAAPYIVDGSSMEPNLHDNHYLFVDKLTYKLQSPERGDVVVMQYPFDTSRSFIKRLIGLPGERIEIVGKTVRVFNDKHPEGFTLDEPYVAVANQDDSSMTLTLKADEFAVFGDNRRASYDSRTWGALPRKDLVGRAFIRLFPFNKIGFYPEKHTFSE